MMQDAPDHAEQRQPPSVRHPQGLGAQAAALWNDVILAGVKAQRLVPGAIAAGGAAAAIHAGHRISQDTDHLVYGLKERFDEVLEILSAAPEWRTARTNRPVLILGSIDQVEVGFREPRRQSLVETVTIVTPGGDLVIPTLEEMLGMKAFLAYSRNTLRDYLDFAALATRATDDQTLGALLKLEEQYRGLQTASVRLEVAKALAGAAPFDLEETDLSRYKGLAPEWRDWRRAEAICRRWGLLLSEKILGGSR